MSVCVVSLNSSAGVRYAKPPPATLNTSQSLLLQLVLSCAALMATKSRSFSLIPFRSMFCTVVSMDLA